MRLRRRAVVIEVLSLAEQPNESGEQYSDAGDRRGDEKPRDCDALVGHVALCTCVAYRHGSMVDRADGCLVPPGSKLHRTFTSPAHVMTRHAPHAAWPGERSRLNAADPDVHVPIVVGGPLTPAHQQVRLRSRSKPVSPPAALRHHLGASVATFMLLDISGCP